MTYFKVKSPKQLKEIGHIETEHSIIGENKYFPGNFHKGFCNKLVKLIEIDKSDSGPYTHNCYIFDYKMNFHFAIYQLVQIEGKLIKLLFDD